MADLEALFPQLKAAGYQPTSEETSDYNCIAWAAGFNDRWWEMAPGYHWPLPISVYTESVQSIVILFQSLGFSVCKTADLEAGYEKVAIYGQDDEYTHAARQLPTGKWTSKIGDLEDIEHETLEGLVGTEYGIVKKMLKRKIPE